MDGVGARRVVPLWNLHHIPTESYRPLKYNPDIHHRRSIRLCNYDYSQTGAYFISICTHGRECLFGNPLDTPRIQTYNKFAICSMYCKYDEVNNGINFNTGRG
ncbi:MAG: hypothetical protein D3924_04515 [Candidatus Electrothrix sp. AR4]|nr:hypothetical protein [Candidatus Electrothrix sp. AR4]